MLRAILGVIVGYVAMFIIIALSFTIAYVIMGVDGAFKEGSYDVSMTWIVVSIVLGLIAAIGGGIVCRLIVARASKAPVSLAILVLILGLLMAIPVMTASKEDQPQTREGDLSSFEAMNEAQQPVWLALLNPVIGAVGVMVGARLVGGSKSSPTRPPEA